MALSYAHGASETPLLGETIGDNLARTATAHPDADALVSCHQDVRWSYAELDERVDRAAAALIAAGLEPGDRVGLWSPNRAEWTLVQYAAARAGIIQVSVNPAYRTSELEFALRQSGCRMLVAAPAFKTSDYVAMTEEVRPALPELEHAIFFDTPEWDELLEAGSAISTDQVRACAAQVAFDDPVNIQYTSGTTGFPKGATLSHHNVLNNGYFVAEYCGYTSADRVCLPVPFYHCFGQVMGNLGCTSHGSCMVIPEASFEPEATLRAVQAERCTSLYGVPTMFIAELGRGHEAGHRPHAHAGRDHRLRHDRDLAGLDPDRRRRPARAPRRHRRPRPPARRDQGGRAGHRAPAAPGRAGRAVHARLQRDAGVLERPRAHLRGDRRRAVDAHRRPRDDGRRGLPQHRRPDQGHDHPRRGEPLPARSRGVPLQPPRDRRRPGHRGARRPLRRGAHGLDHRARGG